MKKPFLSVILFFLYLSLPLPDSFAQPTLLTVTVKAHDAKFVGTAVGDLEITIRDYFSKKILCSGYIKGGTGDTDIIMKKPRTRHQELSLGKDTARFQHIFDIKEPQKLLIEVTGPLGAGIDLHTEQKTIWLIPGMDIKADGIMFTLYGLIVHAYSPSPHEILKIGEKMPLGVHVTPMCGCPVRPGFKLWNANEFSIKALIFHKDEIVAQVPLKYSGKISHFEGEFFPKTTGDYKVVFVASDKSNNQGVAITGFVVVPEKKYHKLLGK